MKLKLLFLALARMTGLVDARSSWNRYSGFAHGSTGIKAEVRSIADG